MNISNKILMTIKSLDHQIESMVCQMATLKGTLLNISGSQVNKGVSLKYIHSTTSNLQNFQAPLSRYSQNTLLRLSQAPPNLNESPQVPLNQTLCKTLIFNSFYFDSPVILILIFDLNYV